ncbi:DEAD/DEAH box helicase [Paenisporosarcina cavernae]|uniref:DEAD/DEAH box helicase n=1 Tax=Paenisporosarcina cavernae TaxID=2320858 RepID=A0A385YQR9_9BACL|nr:DEAD/DEAH box helicase family protein [Paenisporosarcina cavernae]AYC28936.1 DEAD/DEAH box helicase [Paenisporosarcina cavernae]
MTVPFDQNVQAFFSGRIWLRDHTPFPSDVIDYHLQHHFLTATPSIEETHCKRCGNEDLTSFSCAKCQKTCHYCRHCIRMGRCATCASLLIWTGPEIIREITMTYIENSALTPKQRQASDEMLQSHRDNKSHLIHAVCGAGKTEMLFPVIHQMLREKKRICIATPRTDVVLELYPRFQEVFRGVEIHALYGGVEPETKYADMVITTTHQLYRFEHAFDVMIVDEADAFPYSVDASLQFAVNKAKKQHVATHYVTATPDKKLVQKVDKVSEVLERFHGYPLPVPKFESLWRYKKQLNNGIFPGKLKQWIDRQISSDKPFLVFFPTIELMEKAAEHFPEIPALHAESSSRKESVLSLRYGKIPGIFTTTILERGVTISNVQVAVVGADEPIFTTSALIQICGRVGRDKHFPNGTIVYFHHGISEEMDEAVREINRCNRGFSHALSSM